MQIIEVNDAATKKDFVLAPQVILGDDPNYIRVLDKDTWDVFSEKNRLLKRGAKYKLWVAKDDQGNLVGRIAAFVNPKYKNKIPVGGMGFFDSIDNQEVANLLLDTAKEWLLENDMQAMDGPINFGERDRFWGLMVEGFIPPVYAMHYQKAYYQELLENYGFQLYFNQLCYGMKVHHKVPQKYFEKYLQIQNNSDYTFRLLDKSKLKEYAKDFCTVYNAAWAGHGGGKSMDERQAQKIFQSMKPILDPKICFFVYYKNEPVGIWLNIPDINQVMRLFNGRFGLIQKIQFITRLKLGLCKRVVGIIFGVVPQHQNKGVDAMLIVEGSNSFKTKTKYNDFELQWVGDFNPKMVNVAQALEGDLTRRLVTYRYLFDRSAPYERHPIVS